MPTTKILLPIDVQHPHEDVVDRLNSLVHLTGVRVHLLYVREELPGFESVIETMGDFPEDWKHQIDKKITEVFDLLKTKLQTKGAEVTSEIVGGPAAVMIESVARDEGFDIIAIMPGSHSHIEQFLIGSTAGRVVAHAPCTVLLLRSSASGEALSNVVIGIDGSDAALQAAKTAVTLFNLVERNVKVTLVNVVSVTGIFKLISPVRFVAAIEENLVMSGEAALTKAQAELSEMGLQGIEIDLKNGDPADELIKFSESHKAEMILIGAQGRSAVEKFLLGSVSTRVSTFAKCSTAVIK